MEWISIEESGYPKMKYTDHGTYATVEGSKECLVTDGENVWVDEYCLEEGFHSSITHYVIIEEIEPPTIG